MNQTNEIANQEEAWAQMEREVEEYYRTMTKEEIEEDRIWVHGVGSQLGDVWGGGHR